MLCIWRAAAERRLKRACCFCATSFDCYVHIDVRRFLTQYPPPLRLYVIGSCNLSGIDANHRRAP